MSFGPTWQLDHYLPQWPCKFLFSKFDKECPLPHLYEESDNFHPSIWTPCSKRVRYVYQPHVICSYIYLYINKKDFHPKEDSDSLRASGASSSTWYVFGENSESTTGIGMTTIILYKSHKFVSAFVLKLIIFFFLQLFF